MGNLTDFGNIMDQVPTTYGAWFIQDDRLSVPNVDEVSPLSGIGSFIGHLVFCFAREWGWEYLSASLGSNMVRKGCLCATQELPKVECSYCHGDAKNGIQGCCDAKVEDGWCPMGS